MLEYTMLTNSKCNRYTLTEDTSAEDFNTTDNTFCTAGAAVSTAATTSVVFQIIPLSLCRKYIR